MTNAGAARPSRPSEPQRPDGAADRGAGPARPEDRPDFGASKPAVDALGIDVSSLVWRRSGRLRAGGRGAADPAVTDSSLTRPLGTGVPPGAAIEVAFAGRQDGETWVLVRVTGDPAGRILVYDQHEWECFLDGVRKGEFDEAD